MLDAEKTKTDEGRPGATLFAASGTGLAEADRRLAILDENSAKESTTSSLALRLLHSLRRSDTSCLMGRRWTDKITGSERSPKEVVMRGTSLVALALASLLLAAQPAAAASATMNLAVLGGGGVLEGGSTFSVQGMALTVATPRKPVAVSFSNLVLDGAHLHCTVTATDCLAVPATAELTCEDSSVHNVEAGVLGTSFGSLDETPVTAGFIFMKCITNN